MGHIQPLTLDSIDIGSLLEEANAAIERVSNDVLERPHLDKPRKVVVEIEITPDLQGHNGHFINMPVVNYKVKHTIPGTKGNETRAMVKPINGKDRLVVNMADPYSHPDQPTLYDNVEEVPGK